MTDRLWEHFLLGLVLCFIVVAGADLRADNSSTPSKPFTFSPATTILSSQVNSDFDTLYVGLANVGTANILSSGVGTTQLANLGVTLGKLDTTVQSALEQTGVVKDYIGTTAPTGYALADGKTIGDATSGATVTGGGGATYSALYSLLWSSMDDTRAPVSTGRGGSAASDFGNHKTITLPDLRGRIIAGRDNLGGSAASRLTNVSTGANFDATIQGNAGGSQSHTLTTAELAAHNHPVTDTHTHPVTLSVVGAFQAGGSGGYTNSGNTQTGVSNAGAITVGNAGGGTAHGVINPVMVLSKIIKL